MTQHKDIGRIVMAALSAGLGVAGAAIPNNILLGVGAGVFILVALNVNFNATWRQR